MTDTSRIIKAHLFILIAEVMWGISAPIAKEVMNEGMNGFQFVSLRIIGSAILFWIASLFVKTEKVAPRDLLKLGFAGILAIACNQTLFTVGLQFTSPVNASIMTTMMPILTMFLAFLILREPISWKKALGIAFGATGAILIVLHNTQSGQVKAGNALGDVLVISAQLCFALYLTLFKNVLNRYSGVTCMKWMFTFALLFAVPFTAQSFRSFEWAGHSHFFWYGTLYVVVGATFLSYLFLMPAQKTLRPTVVSIYNYVQPLVACLVSIAAGLGVFTWIHALAVILVISGVALVTKSKSRHSQLREQRTSTKNSEHDS